MDLIIIIDALRNCSLLMGFIRGRAKRSHYQRFLGYRRGHGRGGVGSEEDGFTVELDLESYRSRATLALVQRPPLPAPMFPAGARG